MVGACDPYICSFPHCLIIFSMPLVPGICQYPPYSAPVVRIHLAVTVYETLTEANFLYSFSCQTDNEYFVFKDCQENSHLRKVAIHHPQSTRNILFADSVNLYLFINNTDKIVK